MNELSCAEIARIVGGQLVNENNAIKITGVASLEEANESHISFLGNEKYAPQVKLSRAGVTLIPENYPPEDNKSYIICKNPSAAFSQAIDLFAPEAISFPSEIHKSASVSESAKIGQGCHVGPNVVILDYAIIGDNTVISAGSVVGHYASVGNDCLIHPNVTIRERCIIGNRCIIHSGTAIGSDGFGFIPGKDGHKKIPQVGIVVLEDDVEIGSCVCIDRARFGKTKIGKGTKIDNLVQIAHNVEIGQHCFIVSQSGIAGSTKLGNFVIMAAQAGIAGHLQVGNGVTMMGRAGVTKDIEDGETVFGFPAAKKKDFVRQNLRIKKIDRFEKELSELKAKIKELSEQK
jgi:UDP-3-O-[3-hydroxymyristoyl] glucosamine N-acyltransferase